MSQTPPTFPYSHQQRPRHVTVPRRAGALMVALGIMIFLLGGCLLLGSAMPVSQFPPGTQEQIHQIESDNHVTLHTMFLIMGGVLGAIALCQIIMGLLVTRGGKASIITAIVITALVVTLTALQLIFAVVSANAPNVAAGAGMLLILVCLLAWQLAWLIQALHAVKQAPKSISAQASGLPASERQSLVYPPPPPDDGPIGWPYPPPPPAQE